MSVYQLDKIKRFYGGTVVLDAVDLEIEKGKIYALVGENGCGKTTLLETLALLEPPQGGRLFFAGKEVNFHNGLTKLRRKIAYCLQQPHLFQTTVYKNLVYGFKARGQNNVDGQVFNFTKIFGIESLISKSAQTLSVGQTQKVALARTFILETPVLLLDEPTANLDQAGINVLAELLQAAKDKSITIILATHCADIAHQLADEAIVIQDKQAFPKSFENFFSGVIKNSLGLKSFKINEQVRLTVSTEKQGKVKVSIDPKEIIVSQRPFDSSARNCIAGRVCSISDGGSTARVSVDCGIKLVSQITHKSLAELGINVGQQVYLTFKTSSIKVY